MFSSVSRIVKSKVTIADVAKKAGVSMMTVSRVINHHESVKPKTKKNVERAMKSLGYQPNIAAQRLSSGNSGLIGVVCFQSSSAYVSQFIYGCVTRISSLGLHLVIEELDHNQPLAPQMEKLCARIQGLIILPPMHEISDVIDVAKAYKLPTALIGCDLDFDQGYPFLSLHIDDEKASEELTKHLLSMGHKHIGLITGDLKQKVSHQRTTGYQRALKRANIDHHAQLIQEGDFSYRSALMAAERLLSAKPRPTAIFASNDDMAAAVIAEAHRQGLTVPNDLSVVGFDDINTAQIVWPNLTTVYQPLQEMAVHALEFMVSEPRTKRAKLAYKIVKRGSVSRVIE